MCVFFFFEVEHVFQVLEEIIKEVDIDRRVGVDIAEL